MAKILFLSSELFDITSGTLQLEVQSNNLSEILGELLRRFPLLENRFFSIKDGERKLKSTLLIFHNNDLIPAGQVFSYNKNINLDDEIKLLTPFIGG